MDIVMWWKSITLFLGTKARTKAVVLEKLFHNDFEKGQEDTYVIEEVDVGEPLMIKLENNQGGLFHRSSDWFVDKVVISCSSSNQAMYEFPCYGWVKQEALFFEGKGRKVLWKDLLQSPIWVFLFKGPKTIITKSYD